MNAAAPTPVLSARDLRRDYVVKAGLFREAKILRAIDAVSFDLMPGETLAVVGESGCGKSTLGRMVAMIDRPTSGEIVLGGPAAADGRERPLHRRVQMIFQNPYGSLNPRKTVRATLDEPLRINTPDAEPARRAEIDTMLAKVGLRPEHADCYPHMLSGGQRQRVAIARALMLRPEIIVADEPLSALDVSVQAQIINLLMDLRDEFGVAFVLISHDISVVRRLAHKVMVMYLGKVVEYGPARQVLSEAVHPYTRGLIASVPRIRRAKDAPRLRISGEIPSPIDPPSGCGFRTRCPIAAPECAAAAPALEPRHGRLVACPRAGAPGAAAAV
ncbi:MAG: dipeptide ABC transporter ATP-binding protein [Rhizobiaceae bacterium]|nr:dipeptide ABC transporter ATP-binding protein [Rhizobiaceae bacterium]